MSNFLRTQKDKDFILSNVREPYSIENYLSEDDIGELIDVWESSDNKEYKNTGPITSKIENFDNPALSKIRDLIYFGDEVEDRKVHPNIDIWYAMFFYVDAPHIIHMDDRIDTLTQIYKAFNFPLKFEGGSEEPHLMFFDQLYLDGPSKFFNGDSWMLGVNHNWARCLASHSFSSEFFPFFSYFLPVVPFELLMVSWRFRSN